MEKNQTPEKISGKQLWYQFKDAYDIEKGWLYTFLELTLRPGKVLRNYIAGDRRLINPIKYALMAISITVAASLLASLFNTGNEASGVTSLEDNIVIYVLPLISVVCFASVLFLLNVKKGYNFFEYFFVIIYCISHAMIFTSIIWDICLFPVYHFRWVEDNSIIDEILGTAIFLMMIAYMFWVVKVFLQLSFFRTLLNISAIIVLFIVFINVSMVAMDYFFVNTKTYLGLGVSDLDQEVSWFKSGNAVVVSSVNDNSPASKAGILIGDTILKIEGETADPYFFYETIFRFDPGEIIVLTISREGKELEFPVRLMHLDSITPAKQ